MAWKRVRLGLGRCKNGATSLRPIVSGGSLDGSDVCADVCVPASLYIGLTRLVDWSSSHTVRAQTKLSSLSHESSPTVLRLLPSSQIISDGSQCGASGTHASLLALRCRQRFVLRDPPIDIRAARSSRGSRRRLRFWRRFWYRLGWSVRRRSGNAEELPFDDLVLRLDLVEEMVSRGSV